MRALAISVHVLTATGAALALLALIAATRSDWPLMFFWLGIALFVDGIDGLIARALNVADAAPRWSGKMLDLVVDFATYVFVPAYAITVAELMPDYWALAAGFAMTITGALYFADSGMKTDDNYFVGFPAVWNLIAFYLLLLRPAPWLAIAAIGLCAVLTFVPIRFVHPLRVQSRRALTVAMLALWGMLAVVALWQGLAPGLWINAALCLIAVYFLGIGLLPAPVNRR